MEINGLCYLCDAEQGTCSHIFLECPYTRRVADSLQMPLSFGQQGDASIIKDLEDSLVHAQTNQRTLLANIWYAVWNQQNLIWQGKTTARPETTTTLAKANCEAYLSAKYEEGRLSSLADLSSWAPLGMHIVKVNGDFAVDEGNGIHGFGLIIRDDKGDFIATKSVQGWGVMNSNHGELMAIHEGILFAREMGCTRVCFESDSQVAINRIIDETPYYSHNGSIVLDIFSFGQWFELFYRSFVPRRFNYAADMLANFALTTGTTVWTVYPLDFLENVLISYLSSINS